MSGPCNWLVDRFSKIPGFKHIRAVVSIAYTRYLQLFYGRRGLPWEINGQFFFIRADCRSRMAQNYDAAVAMELRKRIRPNACVLNVGANVGVYALQFAGWTTPAGIVWAFEPNPAACEVLKSHIRLNDLGERIQVVPLAIGHEEGIVPFTSVGIDGMSRVGPANPMLPPEAVQQIQVEITSIDSFCRRHSLRPDVLFIDVEGYEIAVLKGASQTVRDRGRALQLAVELHPNAWADSGNSEAELLAWLDQHARRPVMPDGRPARIDEYGIVFLEPN